RQRVERSTRDAPSTRRGLATGRRSDAFARGTALAVLARPTKERAMSMRWIAALVAALWMSACSNEPPECAAGSDGCPCEAADGCDEGLVCMDGTCTGPRELTLSIPGE